MSKQEMKQVEGKAIEIVEADVEISDVDLDKVAGGTAIGDHVKYTTIDKITIKGGGVPDRD